MGRAQGGDEIAILHCRSPPLAPSRGGAVGHVFNRLSGSTIAGWLNRSATLTVVEKEELYYQNQEWAKVP